MTTSQFKKVDHVWRNATVVTMDPTIGENGYGILHNQEILVLDSKILAIQDTSTIDYNCPSVDVQNALITPGLIDCHTHLVFAGDRGSEWEQRLNGVPYATIAKQGGGINTSVKSTRRATYDQLIELSTQRLQAFINEGVTTIEIKSGYGLDLENERKQLQVAQQLENFFDIEVVKTLLAAHTVPNEFKDNPDGYVDLVCNTIIPTLQQENLFEAVDVFCETVGFNLEQTEKILKTATQLGLKVKGHTEQLSNLGGSSLVSRYHGLSVDHIEYLDEQGVNDLKQQNTVAVVLPLAYYFLREIQKPPIELLRKYKVPIAVSTDFNPGTAPFASLRLAMNMACVLFSLTPLEAWQGVTINAAKALGRAQTHGKLAVGYMADFIVWNSKHPVDIIYELGKKIIQQRVFRGKITNHLNNN